MRAGAILRAYGTARPRLHDSVWVAPGAALIGDVEIGEDSSVFFGSVLRGDVEGIRIGERTNIQDQATLHVTADRFPTILGSEITVGHRAVVHGCRVGDGALVGIGAILLDGAEVGENAWVAAGAVVRPGQKVAPATLFAGVPARKVRPLRSEEIEVQRAQTLRYIETARMHSEASRLSPIDG
ncbi:MAG: gamma carbonic anhydrase family protein [bacterium]|nr:gamma carbonic anhydrase family protein [Deltaproteobacteria bacterium]MCP4904197.1 gamma carbonic anhydrase family protein [bacterium]